MPCWPVLVAVLLNQALSRQQLAVTQADIDAEVTRAAETLGFRTPSGEPDIDAWLGNEAEVEQVGSAGEPDAEASLSGVHDTAGDDAVAAN